MSQFINNPEHTFWFRYPAASRWPGERRSRIRLPRRAYLPDHELCVPQFPARRRPLWSCRRRQHLRPSDQLHPGRLRGPYRRTEGWRGRVLPSPPALLPSPIPVQALAQAGDHVVAQKTIYGGSTTCWSIRSPSWRRDHLRRCPQPGRGRGGAIRTTPRSFTSRRSVTPNSDIPNIDAISGRQRSTVCRLSSTTPSAPVSVPSVGHGANIVVHLQTKFTRAMAPQLGGKASSTAVTSTGRRGKYAQIAEPNPPTTVSRCRGCRSRRLRNLCTALSCCVTRALASVHSTPGSCSRAPRRCRCALTAMSKTPRRSLSSWLVTATSPR